MAALADLIPEADALLALEPDELGVMILKITTVWPPMDGLSLEAFLRHQVNPPSWPGQGLPLDFAHSGRAELGITCHHGA